MTFKFRIQSMCLLLVLMFHVSFVGSALAGGATSLRTHGALRAIFHEGMTGEAVNLGELLPNQALYGVGAITGLRGEVTIMAGEAYLSYPRGAPGSGMAETNTLRTSREGATLLVTAQPGAWRSATTESAITFDEFDESIVALAELAGVDWTRPFVFRMDGVVNDLQWHIIDGRLLPGGGGSHEDHLNSAVKRQVASTHARLVGFHSLEHHGVFTHTGSNSHIHCVVNNPISSGHVDHVVLPAGTEVYFGIEIAGAESGIDTVRVGSNSLRPDRIANGTQSFESYRLENGHRVPTSTTTQTVMREHHHGLEVIVIHTLHTSEGGDTTVSSITARARDLALMHHQVRAERDSASLSAAVGRVTGWVVLPDLPIRLIDVQFDHPVFPMEGQIPWIINSLPLQEGYKAAIPHFSPWHGGEKWSHIRVTGSESIEGDGNVVDCWVVDAGEIGPPGYRATRWVEKETGKVVQSALRGDPGKPEFWTMIR